ncbi:MAG: ATP-binding protein [Parachlamydiales bacterium]
MRFRAHIDQLAAMLAWIRAEGARAGLGPQALHQVELASEEGITNIIRHAYPKGREGEIEIECGGAEGGGFRVALKDEGESVNPLQGAPAVNPDASAEERSLGGLGIFLIQSLMDEVSYQRQGKQNILTLLKR